ncbi:MAG: methionyl-tRNA formyltransferase [Gammaproteobacteria bacterium]|nr:methionyl-tRNA formyltransferase [Gammaproteobacteria bacterium]
MNQKKRKPKVIFAGTATFAVPILERLLKISEIVLVLTQPARPAGRGLQDQMCPIDEFAQDNHLPVFRPLSLKKEDIGQTIQQYPCDYLIVAAYGKIIPQWLLDWPAHEPLNIHCSLLPRWRGAAPIQHALLAGDSVSGTCVMRMTAGLDEGPVHLSQRIPITKNDNQETMTEKLSQLGADLLQSFLAKPEKYPATSQIGDPTYAHKIEKNHGLIDWKVKSATWIDRAFRAFYPWPGLYCLLSDSRRLKIIDCRIIEPTDPIQKKLHLTPNAGSAICCENRLFIQTASSDWIELKKIQLEGYKPCEVSEIAHDPSHWIHKILELI